MIFRPFSLPCAPAVRPASPCQGPPRCANVVIHRGERRNSGKLNAPSAFRSCKLVPTPSPSPRVSAEFILSLGPPRSANAVILRGERRSSGELNAPVRFGLISLLRRCLLARHLMPAYVLFVVSRYHPDVYFCSVRESSGRSLHSQYVFFSASKRGGVLSSIPRDRIRRPLSISPAFDAGCPPPLRGGREGFPFCLRRVPTSGADRPSRCLLNYYGLRASARKKSCPDAILFAYMKKMS